MAHGPGAGRGERRLAAPIEVRRQPLDAPAVVELIRALNAELSRQYPEEGATHFNLEPEQVASDRGAFLVASMDGAPVGCGAVRRIEPGTAEIKRMYVVPERRGQGIARTVLASLEEEARRLGVRRIVLETGTRQHEAIALYESAGFRRIPAFGEYVGCPLSICMAKEVAPLERGPSVRG